jgi:hypothetical protein
MPPVNSSLPAPWADFLQEVDRLLPNPVELQCLGGFVLVTRYGFPRATNDIDYLPTLPPDEQHRLLEIAGMGSSLHKRFHVYIQCVGGVTSLAENYEARLLAKDEVLQRQIAALSNCCPYQNSEPSQYFDHGSKSGRTV